MRKVKWMLLLVLLVNLSSVRECLGKGVVFLQDANQRETSRLRRLQRDVSVYQEPSGIGEINNASFGVTYTGSVMKGAAFLYEYTYKELVNTTTAVRIRVSAPGASEDYPVLFVVRQQRHIISWQVPLLLENVFDYYNVSRTLCPLEHEHKHSGMEEQQIIADVSSSSEKPTKFVLEAVYIDDFELTTGKLKTVVVTPSEPKYYQYEFKEGVDSVVVKVESDDELCMVVSVQDVQCPVYDLVRNVEFTGEYQTVTKKGAITLQKSAFHSLAFFVVLVVRPSDYDCTGIETIRPASHGAPGSEGLWRKKKKVPTATLR